MSASTVADLVLSEVKDEVRSMQGSGEGLNGYVKLRRKDADGNLIAVTPSGGSYEGTTIEYIAANVNEAAVAVQIDAEGCDAVLVDGDGRKEVMIGETAVSRASLAGDHLTMRYYSRYPENLIMGYKNLFMDTVISGTSAEASGNYAGLTAQKIVWHATERLPQQSYQGYGIELLFQVKPVADSEGNPVVDYVDITVRVKEEDTVVLEKVRRVDLQNVVFYKNGNTLYSDGTE